MTDDQFKQILSAISELKAGIQVSQLADVRIESKLAIIDKRLSLIEQRLSNIEPFISVGNKHLEFHD